MKLDLDTRVRCSDDTKARLVDVVIEPRGRDVTHVVVAPPHGSAPHRLVPIDRIDDRSEGGIRLLCSSEELEDFPVVDHTDFFADGELPVASPGWAVGITSSLTLPFLDAELDARWNDVGLAMEWDRIPADEVEIRRDSTVMSKDRLEIGTVDGFVCDDDAHITHLVLKHGHVFGRRDIAIPISEVRLLDNGTVRMDLTADEVDALPGVSVHRWHRPR